MPRGPYRRPPHKSAPSPSAQILRFIPVAMSRLHPLSILNLLLGRPLTSRDKEKEKIGVSAGIPAMGLDALSSSAYGPEAALTILLPLGAAGVAYLAPI